MKKIIISLALALVMVLSLLPLAASADNTTEAGAQPIELGQTVTMTGQTDYYFRITMPYDGVVNASMTRIGNSGVVTQKVSGSPAGFSSLSLGARDNSGSIQYALREGEYTIRITAPRSDVVTYSVFVTPALDTTWAGTADREPNDTPETAIALAPDTIATGNIGASAAGLLNSGDVTDLYKFTLTSKSEVELRAKAVDTRLNTSIVRLGGSASGLFTVTQAEGWVSRNYTLDAGDYQICIVRNSLGGFTGYEIEYRILSSETPPIANVPTAPRNLAATPGDRQVALSWSAPSDTGGNPVIRYEVSRDGGNTWVTASSNTGHTFTELTNGTSYSFSVRAVTSAGPGTAATAVTATPNPAQPTTPPPLSNNMSAWAIPEITKAYEMGLIPDSLLNPSIDYTRPITRAEFAGVAVKTYENMTGTQVLPAVTNPFRDASDLDVLKAYNAGIMVGISANQFAPATLLNREQCATALTRVYKRGAIPGWSFATDANHALSFTWPQAFADDHDISGWARESVYFMVANGIIQGVGNNMFAPRAVTTAQQAQGYAQATREQALAIAVRMVENLR